jgi:hypothetical protein
MIPAAAVAITLLVGFPFLVYLAVRTQPPAPTLSLTAGPVRTEWLTVQLHDDHPGSFGLANQVGQTQQCRFSADSVLGPMRQLDRLRWTDLDTEPRYLTIWKGSIVVGTWLVGDSSDGFEPHCDYRITALQMRLGADL